MFTAETDYSMDHGGHHETFIREERIDSRDTEIAYLLVAIADRSLLLNKDEAYTGYNKAGDKSSE